MSDRLIQLRVKNQSLQKEVESLTQKVLSLVGNIEIHGSGGPGQKIIINDKLLSLINSTTTQLNIISPKIDRFYTNEIKKIAEKGNPVLIITNERRGIPDDFLPFFDELKATPGISIISNPNVKFLLVFNMKEALYSGGSLDREELNRSVLIVTIMREQSRLKKIAEIFTRMLPSFMRR